MALLDAGRPIYHGGLTSMFPFAAGEAGNRLFGADHAERVGVAWNAYTGGINSAIANREFDLLMLKPQEYRFWLARPSIPQRVEQLAPPALMRKHYQLQETLELSLTDRLGGGTHTIEVWVPRQGLRANATNDSPSGNGTR